MKASRNAKAAIGAICLLAATFQRVQSSDIQPAVLTIKVENVSLQGGALQIALYDEAGYGGHDQRPVAKVVVDARAPETVVKIPNVRPGAYAVKMFQDFHRTGSFAMSALGVPEEPFGFSNDARPLLDQPAFDRAKFVVFGGETSIVVHLQLL